MRARSKASLIAFFYTVCVLLPRVTLAETADEAALIARLHGPQDDARAAAQALGRMRSNAGLKIILDGDDDYLIHQFGVGGNQSGRGAVLPAEIEALIVSHHDRLTSSRYGNLVDIVIDGSRYQSRELLRLLLADSRRIVETWRRGEQPPRSPDASFSALTKTDLPIGQDVLGLIRDIPSHPTTISPRCSLAGYFKDHSEASAVPALVDVLRKSDEQFVASCISSVLGAMATSESIGAVIHESKRVAPTNATMANAMLSALINQLRLLKPDVTIDISELRQALPPPGQAPDLVSNYIELVRHRKAAASVPFLVSHASAENVSDGFQRTVIQALLDVGSRDDWANALESVERGFTEKRVSGSRLEITRSMLGPRIDPEGYRSREAAAGQIAYDAGRRGDAKFLADAIAQGDAPLIREFTRGLRSVDRPHIPPEIEVLIVAHFDEGEVGRMLPVLIGPEESGLKPSRYHGREVFDRFAEQMRKGSGPDPAKRIFATDSPIEEPLLALLTGPHLYSGSCEAAKYLAKRRYAPVIPYLKNALAVGMTPETTNGGCPKEALVEFGTPEALAAAALPDQWAADQRAPAVAEVLRKANAVPPGTPVDFEALRRAIGTPIPKSVADDYCRFAMLRKPPEAVPDLLALVSERASGAALYGYALSALLAYDSPDVWKRTRQEVERLYKEQRIGQWSHDDAVAKIDALLADPQKTIAQRNLQRPHPADGALEGWDETKLLAEIAKVEGQSARDVAAVLGEHSSERGFEALVKRRDPSLVQAFAGGMLKSQAKLTPAMESVVLANLQQDERLSGALKYLVSLVSYHDRRMFDRFADEIVRAGTPMDRAMIAPVLTKTDLPVEAEVVALLARLPKGPQEMMARCPLVRFLGERRFREAVKPLSSEIQTATPEMSRCIATALDKIGTAEALAAVMERVRTLRADPATAQVATWIETEAVHTVKDVPAGAPAAFLEAKRATTPTPAPLAPKPGDRPFEITKALETDPAAHVKDVESRLDALASALRPGQIADRDLVEAYFRVASVRRFTLKDADHAITVYEKIRPLARPENGGVFAVDFAIADVEQFDKRRPADAIDHLKKVLEQSKATAASAPDRRGAEFAEMLDPINAWVREDIRFLETGQPFNGPLSLQSMSLLFMGMLSLGPIGPDPRLPPMSEVFGGTELDGRMPEPPHDILAKRLLSLPPSRGILFQTMSFLSRLEPDEILAHLAHQDPGRYLTAIILATAAAEDYELELGRRVGRSMFVRGPEPGERYTRSSLRVAAERFAKASGIRFDTPPFVREQAATPQEIDVVVKSAWKKVKDALRKGDVEAALGGVAIGERAKYRPVFQALKDGKTDIDKVMTEIHKVEIRDDRAEYAMLRQENGKMMSFMVEFVRDADGIWRLRNM